MIIIIIMNIQVCLVVCVLLISCLAEDNREVREVKRICAYGFSEAQWQSQQSSNTLYVNKAKQTFKTPSISFIRKIIRYQQAENRQSEKQQLLQHIAKITPQLQQYSVLYKYMFFILALIFLYWALTILQKRYSVNYYICSSRNYKSISKAVKYCLLICAVISLCLSIIGYREGNKTVKTLSNLVCNIFEQPKGIIRGGSGAQYDGFDAFIVHIQRFLGKLTSNYESIKRVIQKMYIIEQMIKFGKQMSIVTLKRDEQFSSQMNKTVTTLQQIKQKLLDVKLALHWHNRTVQQSRELVIMLKYQFKVVQNYAKRYFPFTTIFGLIGSSIQIFYVSIILLSLLIIVYMGFEWSRKKFVIRKSVLQYLMTMAIIICLSTAYLNSFIVPGIVWLSPIVDSMSQHQNNIRHQLNGSKLDLLQILSTFVPIQGKDLTQIYYGQFMGNMSQLDSIIRPYYSANTTYFDQLFQKGISLSNQSPNIDLTRIRFLQKQMLMKNILVNFQKAKEGIKQILTTVEPKGQLAIINPSAIGDYARDIYRVIRGPLFNRIYNARWICGSIGTLLLIGLICLTLIKVRQVNNKNEQQSLQKLPSYEVQSQQGLDSVS